jgi:hypothetical protein
MNVSLTQLIVPEEMQNIPLLVEHWRSLAVVANSNIIANSLKAASDIVERLQDQIATAREKALQEVEEFGLAWSATVVREIKSRKL